MTFDDFASCDVQTGDTHICIRTGGSGPPLLLLHGFPETHLMWRDIAPLLGRHFSVVCADLRGYGSSGCPPSAPDHSPYSKRTMAQELVAVMETLGFFRFGVAGHDRGGRVAHRMALDHPDRIERLAVLDIIPSETTWERADARFALGFWPWSLLAQPAPLPERFLAAAADAIVEHALGLWGSSAQTFPPHVRAAYVAALRDADHAHAICEEYRAASTVDRDIDRGDRTQGRRITCPVLVLWSARGPLAEWYKNDGGPIAVWNQYAVEVSGHAVDAGHFFPEELPVQTAEALTRFYGRRDSSIPIAAGGA